MLCTEDEAKEKDCCGPPQCGRWEKQSEIQTRGSWRCIGSLCMAWWWGELPHADDLPEGFCGLAGRPTQE